MTNKRLCQNQSQNPGSQGNGASRDDITHPQEQLTSVTRPRCKATRSAWMRNCARSRSKLNGTRSISSRCSPTLPNQLSGRNSAPGSMPCGKQPGEASSSRYSAKDRTYQPLARVSRMCTLWKATQDTDTYAWSDLLSGRFLFAQVSGLRRYQPMRSGRVN
jgi:hypothetical protein